jgi:hypothetical protein
MTLHIKLSAEMNASAAARHTRDKIKILLLGRAAERRDLARISEKSGALLYIEGAKALERLAYELEIITID